MINKETKQIIKKLQVLKDQVIDAEVKIIGYQDNEKLLKILDEEYKIFSPTKNQILSLLDGKKPLTKVDNNTKKELEFSIKGNCFLSGIDPLDKTGQLLPFNKLIAKISKEINLLNKPQKIQFDLLDFLDS
jgi:hypothetical protein